MDKKTLDKLTKKLTTVTNRNAVVYLASVNYGNIYAFTTEAKRDTYLKKNASYKDQVWLKTVYTNKTKKEIKEYFKNELYMSLAQINDYPVRFVFDLQREAKEFVSTTPNRTSVIFTVVLKK